MDRETAVARLSIARKKASNAMYSSKVRNFHGFFKEKRTQGGERKQFGIWEGGFQVLLVIQSFLLPLGGQLLVSLLSTGEGK